MAVILNDPMESTANWTGSGLTTVAGRTANGMRIGSTNTATYTIPAGALRVTGNRADFWFKASATTGASRPMTLFRVAGTTWGNLTIDTNGALVARGAGTSSTVVGQTANGAVTANVFHHVEMNIISGASTGSVQAWFNGVQFANGTGLAIGASGPYDAFQLPGIGITDNIIIDDFVLETWPSGPAAKANVWDGSAFVDATAIKVWNGTAFVDATAAKVWNGSAFVDAV